MKRKPYIYKIVNLINGKTYVGQHNGNQNYYFGSGKLLRKAIKKYTIINFKKEIIVQGDFNPQLLGELEKHYIQLYSPTKSSKSYNLLKGGLSTRLEKKDTKYVSRKWTEKEKEIRCKLLKDNKEKYLLTRPRGEKHQNWKIPMTKEHKEKLLKGGKEYRFKNHFIPWNKNKKLGPNFYNNKNTKIILQYDLEGNFVKEWPSANHVLKTLGISAYRIGQCCKQVKQSAGYYKWKYKKEVTNV